MGIWPQKTAFYVRKPTKRVLKGVRGGSGGPPHTTSIGQQQQQLDKRCIKVASLCSSAPDLRVSTTKSPCAFEGMR
eukprot:2928851-Pyramimonas_sp.AAC.2